MVRKTALLGFQCLYNMECPLPALQGDVVPMVFTQWLHRFDITLGLHSIFSSWTSGMGVQ